MADAPTTTASTEVPAKHEGAGFPPFKTETFPSQIFWLVLTFGFLFVVLWRVAGPRINGAITNRRGTINSAIKEATRAREDAAAAQAGYEAAVAAARANANALAEETRVGLNAEIAKAKTDADAQAAKAMHDADARITATRETAKAAVSTAARDAAIAIVERLTGDKVSADDAAKAMGELSMEMFHLDNPEFWVLVGFVLVIALLLWKGVPAMVGKMLDQRAAIIAAELDEARRLRAEAAALLEDYKQRAAGAEAEAQVIVADAKAQAAQFAADSRTALAQQIERRAAAAKDKIAQAEAAALLEIRGLAADAAVSGAQKLIAARLDEKRASDLIAGSIKSLGEKLN